MAIRTIKWLVDSNGKTISPTRVQDGGVQGDHNATRAEFLLPSSFADGFTLYIEYVDAAGGYDKTDPLETELTTPPDSYRAPYKVCAPLPLAWTQLGGTATLRLVATKGNGDTDTETTYTLEGKVRYQPRAGIVGKVDSLVRGCIQEAMDKLTDSLESVDEHINKADEKLEIVLSDAQSSAADAAQAAREAQASASAAQHIAATVQKGDKGDQGDKGDKGDTPVRGVDYWTEADKAETNEYIDEQIGGIEQAVDNVLAVQETLIGGEVSTQIDFVVEEGTPIVVAGNYLGETTKITGNFKYRKWNSGALDIFGNFTSPTITFTTNTSGDMAFCSGSTTYPVLYFRDAEGNNLFNEIPLCAVVGNPADSGAVVGATVVGDELTAYDYGVMVVYNSLLPRTGTSSYSMIPIHVRGTWK